MLKKNLLALFLAGAVFAAHADPKDETSVRIFQAQMQLAQSGDAAGQYYVGEMYEKGLGTNQDLKLAHSWYTKSAAQGNALAKDKVANWERIQQDIAKAKEDTHRAAQIAREAAKAEERAAAEARARQQAEARDKERAAAEARAKQLAAEKERAEKEVKARPTPPPAAAPVPVATQPAKAPVAPAKAAKSASEKEKEDAAFSANPCKGPSAKFLSTCK